MGIVVTGANIKGVKGQAKHWVYNALDVTGTRAVFDTLWPRLGDATGLIYGFERACQNPALAMMREGILVDKIARNKSVQELGADMKREIKKLNEDERLVAVWDMTELETGDCPKPTTKNGKHKWPRGVPDEERFCENCGAPRIKIKQFNPASPQQCNHLFYNLFKIPPLRNKKGDISTDDDVLNRIKKKHPKLAWAVDGIKHCRDYKKQIGTLKSPLTATDRWTSTFNVGQAWTGRWSSSKSPYKQGNNLQNIGEQHRRMFVADPGYELFYADLKQAESMTVAYLSGDKGYMDAHLSGDTHTFVARLLFPDIEWTGDIKKDKEIAKSMYPEWDQAEGHDLRYQAKRAQHGSNYGLSAYGVAMMYQLKVKLAKRIQQGYFEAFPGVRAWQKSIKEMVVNEMPLINPLGRRVKLFGRPWDDHTYKQGLAFIPQSTVADIINIGLYFLWKRYHREPVVLFAQVHDAIFGQWPIERRDEAIEKIVECMEFPVKIGDKIMKIPVEIKAGKNWGPYSKQNPKGMVEVY